MDLPLNNVLNLTKEEIENSKIEFNMQAGSGGQPFLDRWLKHSGDEKKSGTCTDCSYWGWYGKQRNFYPGQWVFSFARMTDDEWLLISAAEIVDVPADEWATVNVLDYHRLADIFNGRILPTYYEALKKITGVYCLTDTHTGKLYIGSATGEEGVAQRWGNYLDSKHGGNKKLIALYEQKGSEYFEKHFTYTLLEYFGLLYDPIKILEREQYWKKCLDTIRNGYNDN